GPELRPVHALRIGAVSADVVFQVPALVFIDGDKHGDELVIHVLRPTIRERHAAPRHDDAPEEARGYVTELVRVRMVEPEDRARVVRSRPSPLRYLPHVSVGGTGRHAAVLLVRARSAVVVIRSLRVLLV